MDFGADELVLAFVVHLTGDVGDLDAEFLLENKVGCCDVLDEGLFQADIVPDGNEIIVNRSFADGSASIVAVIAVVVVAIVPVVVILAVAVVVVVVVVIVVSHCVMF